MAPDLSTRIALQQQARAEMGKVVNQLPLHTKTGNPFEYKEGHSMKEKTLGNTDINGTHKNVPDVVVYGNGDTFALWLKASSQNEGWMKTSKVANVSGGCLVQTETQQRNPDGSYALSQALAFVPGVWLDKATDPPRMMKIEEYESVRMACHDDCDDDGRDSGHEHKKVYSTYTPDTFPTFRWWICSVCGLEGKDPRSEMETFEDIRQRFAKED